MSDELSRLQSALRATSPRAPDSARERAISEAMTAFDRHHQGTGDETRHRGQVPKRGTSWIRRLAMALSRPSLAFAGSAAVLVVAGIVSHQVLMTPHEPPAQVARITSADRTDTAPEGSPAPAPRPTEVELPVETADLAPPEPSRLPEAAAAPVAPAEAVAAAPVPPPKVLPDPIYELSRSQADEARMRAEMAWAEHIQKSRRVTRTAGVTKSLESVSPSVAYDSGERYHAAPSHDRFAEFTPNPVKVVTEEPVSTFCRYRRSRSTSTPPRTPSCAPR